MVAAPAGELASASQLAHLLAPVVSEVGLDLETVDVARAGRRQVVRVVVDRHGGADLDAIAVASRAVSAALDAAEVGNDRPYVLEVSSPGVDRPLTEPRHWERAVGRLVRITRIDGAVVIGRIVRADGEGVHLHGPDTPDRLGYADVRHARVAVEFSGRQPDDDAQEGG